MSILHVTDELPEWVMDSYQLGQDFLKHADDKPEIAYNLSGMLYLAGTGWLLLSVPNSMVLGLFKAMSEPGVELPPGPDGKLVAHISVMRPEEVNGIGADNIKERGKHFQYTLGRLYSTEPDGWPEMSKVWFWRVHSPALQELRRSYGLSSLPKDGKQAFHISVAVKRRGVLGRNEMSKVNLTG